MTSSWTKRFSRYLCEVAHFPPSTVWQWGKQPSFLAWLVACAFFVARCLSPLQHVKQFHRTRKESLDTKLPENQESRSDFPALYTEIYYIAAFACILIIYLLFKVPGYPFAIYLAPGLQSALPAMNCLFKGIALILAIETIVWICYYLLWRSFAEPVYTLYHPAEYFVLFPVVLLVQTMSLTVLLDSTPSKVFLALVDVSEDPEWLVALGKFYFVVIIANLLSMFPQTRFKDPP